jgi:hypothetical protein
MPLFDDGDIVRGLGFVTMYAAWVEEEVDDLLRLLEPIESFDEKKQRWPISRKLRHAAQLIPRLASDELKHFPEALERAIDIFERRNEFVHGRIFAGQDRVDYMQSGRTQTPTRPIASAELYELANELTRFRGFIYGPQIIRVPRALARYRASPPNDPHDPP